MNIKYAAVPIILMMGLTGCKLEKPNEPSDYQKNMERISALEANYANRTAVTPPVTPAVVAIPFVQVPQPECVTDVFRVSRCVDGKNAPW